MFMVNESGHYMEAFL